MLIFRYLVITVILTNFEKYINMALIPSKYVYVVIWYKNDTKIPVGSPLEPPRRKQTPYTLIITYLLHIFVTLELEMICVLKNSVA